MRRGLKRTADLWGSVGHFGGGDFGDPNVRSTFWENLGVGRSNVCPWVGAGLSRLLVGIGDGW
ncbi:hypothetical protein QUB47_34350 [Microcoleus sp. AT9_B5]